MFRAVIFDLDDTLYPEMEYVKAAFRHTAAFLSVRYGLEKETVSEQMLENLLKNGRGRIFNRISEQYHLNADISELVNIYRETEPVLHLYPDAEAVLLKLKEINSSTGLITDGYAAVQRAKVKALHLENRIKSVIVTDELGMDEQGRRYSKPSPFVFQRCLDELCCKPEDAVYIGDNPQKDFIGARQLGMKTIRVVREEGDHCKDKAAPGYDADYEIRELTDILV